MPVLRKTLSVLPNPWTYIDHNGRAAGVVPFDAHEHNPGRGWVGATIASAEQIRAATNVRVAGVNFETSAAAHELSYAYAEEPVTIPNTAYYREQIQRGALFAADAQTAQAAGLERLVPPTSALSKARAEAIKQFNAENGEEAYETLLEQSSFVKQTILAKPSEPPPPGTGGHHLEGHTQAPTPTVQAPQAIQQPASRPADKKDV